MHAPLLLSFYIGVVEGETNLSIYGQRKVVSEALGVVYGKFTLYQTQGMWEDQIEHGFKAEVVLLDGDHALAFNQAQRVAKAIAERLNQKQVLVTVLPLYGAVPVTSDASLYEGASNAVLD